MLESLLTVGLSSNFGGGGGCVSKSTTRNLPSLAIGLNGSLIYSGTKITIPNVFWIEKPIYSLNLILNMTFMLLIAVE